MRGEHDGAMLHGEAYVPENNEPGAKRYWYHFDEGCGATTYGWRWVDSSGGKWVYYELGSGRMLHGEAYLTAIGEDDGEKFWYYLNDATGGVTYGWKELDEKTVYYDLDSGHMVYGDITIDGVTYRFDSGSGALIGEVGSTSGTIVWDDAAEYSENIINLANQYGSKTNWFCTVDKSRNRIVILHREKGSWVVSKQLDCITSARTFTSTNFTVDHKARALWNDQAGINVNDWWVCFVPAYSNDSKGGVRRYYPGLGYDDGQGFHYGFSGSGCAVIPDYAGAKWIYDNVDVGSRVVVF